MNNLRWLLSSCSGYTAKKVCRSERAAPSGGVLVGIAPADLKLMV